MYVGASYLYVSWPGSSDNDDGQFARGRLGFARFQDLMRAHEADLLAVQPEVLAAFYRFDLVRGKLQRPENRSEREGVGFTANFDQQRTQDGKRQRQLKLEARPLTGLRRDANTATHPLDHALDHIQTHAAAGDFRAGVLHREAGQEQELQQFGLRQIGGGFDRPKYPRICPAKPAFLSCRTRRLWR